MLVGFTLHFKQFLFFVFLVSSFEFQFPNYANVDYEVAVFD
jgi:hypothetical protein